MFAYVMCRLIIEFIKNNEFCMELQLNIFRKSHQNRTKFVAFQIVTTEFCSAFYALSCERVGI